MCILSNYKANCFLAENIIKLCKKVENRDKPFLQILIENNIISSDNTVENSVNTLTRFLIK